MRQAKGTWGTAIPPGCDTLTAATEGTNHRRLQDTHPLHRKHSRDRRGGGARRLGHRRRRSGSRWTWQTQPPKKTDILPRRCQILMASQMLHSEPNTAQHTKTDAVIGTVKTNNKTLKPPHTHHRGEDKTQKHSKHKVCETSSLWPSKRNSHLHKDELEREEHVEYKAKFQRCRKTQKKNVT